MRPKYTRPDANQSEIETELQQLGFMTYRTADCSIKTQGVTGTEFHPLDLLVIGLSRKTNRVTISLWEIKVSENSRFTQHETLFINEVVSAFNIYYFHESPVQVARSTEEILKWYGWV